jgi:hypothetical protein
MKKKILAVVAALAVMSVGSTALAAGSPVAGTTAPVEAVEGQTVEVTVEAAASAEEMNAATSVEGIETELEGVEITQAAVSDATVGEAVVATQNALADVADLGTILGDEELVSAAKDDTKTVTATILSVINLVANENYIPGTPVDVTVKHEGVKAGKTYAVLHYIGDGEWETLKATVLGDGALKFTTTSFSPFAIVEITVEDKEIEASAAPGSTGGSTGGGASNVGILNGGSGKEESKNDTVVDVTNTGDKSDDQSSTINGTVPTGTSASDATVTTGDNTAATPAATPAGSSPKTGETTPVALFALLVCVAGAAICSKKSKKN